MSRRLLAAALVSAAAGGLVACGDDDPQPLDVATSPSLSVVGTEMAFDPDEIAVPAGLIQVELRNEGAVRHDLRFEGQIPFLIEAAPGETATGTVQLESGTYAMFCSIDGHREAGMEGVVEVRAPG